MATKKIPVIYDDEIDPIPATQMSQEQLNEHRNYYTFERATKYDKHMPSQKELMAKVNGKYITFEQFITEVLPTGMLWVCCENKVIPFPMSWEPGYVRFTEYGRKEYAGLLKCIVEINSQGFLNLFYGYHDRARMFVADMNGVSSRSRIQAVFG